MKSPCFSKKFKSQQTIRLNDRVTRESVVFGIMGPDVANLERVAPLHVDLPIATVPDSLLARTKKGWRL
jgi:hypothetical protein